jgi:hypothetical protein
MLHGIWSFWTSALLFSIIFAGLHLSNPGENKFGIVMVFIDGMACASVCGARETFGSQSVITPGVRAKHSCSVHPTVAFTSSTFSRIQHFTDLH